LDRAAPAADFDHASIARDEDLQIESDARMALQMSLQVRLRVFCDETPSRCVA
jgi:hypothetical protein